MPVSPSLVVSLVAVAAIVLICRWVFSTPDRTAPPAAPAHEDLGLLVPVAEVATQADAERLRALLSDAGVRADASMTPAGVRVLVFGRDLELARQLVDAR